MLFTYKAIDSTDVEREGTVEAASIDSAMSVVQSRGYTILSIDEVNKSSNILDFNIELFNNVSNKDIVILSRQLATLFQAKVSALRIFRLLSAEVENKKLQLAMNKIVEDLTGGTSIHRALSSHPDIFSPFYVNLVRAGEESGTLDKSFNYLADYLDRQYAIKSKATSALIYPAFVIGIFILVMILMMTLVIPNIAQILIEAGQELPIYTKIVIAISNFLVNYIGLVLLLVLGGVLALWRFVQTPVGRRVRDEFVLSVPYLGDLQSKLMLTRICDNFHTMLSSGISVVQALEVTADVVDNTVFQEILSETLESVQGGQSFAVSLSEHKHIPDVLTQMAQIGEESGNLSNILNTLSDFYRREVNEAVDTMISLIEPAMMVLLGLGVGFLLTSVLLPIYNLTSTI